MFLSIESYVIISKVVGQCLGDEISIEGNSSLNYSHLDKHTCLCTCARATLDVRQHSNVFVFTDYFCVSVSVLSHAKRTEHGRDQKRTRGTKQKH